MFLPRAKLLDKRPAIFALQADAREATLRQAAEMGMTIFHLSEGTSKQQYDAAPDITAENLSDVDNMPPMVKHLKCDGVIEGGPSELGCDDHKYTANGTCDNRGAGAPQHPGL